MGLAQFMSSTRLRDFDVYCDGECKREKRKKIGRNLKNREYVDQEFLYERDINII